MFSRLYVSMRRRMLQKSVMFFHLFYFCSRRVIQCGSFSSVIPVCACIVQTLCSLALPYIRPCAPAPLCSLSLSLRLISERNNYTPHLQITSPHRHLFLLRSPTYTPLLLEIDTYIPAYTMTDLTVPCRAPYKAAIVHPDNDTIILKVGRGDDMEKFSVAIALLCDGSEYFADR